MSFVRIYLRVLGLLGAETRLAITLAAANIALAVAQFDIRSAIRRSLSRF